MRIAESTEATRPNKLGQLTVYAEEELISKSTAELTFRCTDLENKDFFSKSVSTLVSAILLWNYHNNCLILFYFIFLQDPFLVISKNAASGTAIPICRTEVLKNNLKPEWKPIFINISQVGSKVCIF